MAACKYRIIWRLKKVAFFIVSYPVRRGAGRSAHNSACRERCVEVSMLPSLGSVGMDTTYSSVQE